VLRVATYNIHSCVGAGGRYDPQRVISVVREMDADIVALQEIGGYAIEGGEQVDFFARHLQLAVTAGPNLRRRQTQFGNALFVKGRILETRLIDLTVLPFEPRGAIDATVETDNGTTARVIATHLGLLRRERRLQIGRIGELLQERSHPLTIILGDFNVFGRERSILHRIGAPSPLPKLYSFPSWRPLMSLDRLWVIPNDRMSSLRVHRTPLSRGASDHLPLLAEIDPGEAARPSDTEPHALEQAS
jgi:endonuclease/exonuclease/phosphatase family metal-dependent hydrolase